MDVFISHGAEGKFSLIRVTCDSPNKYLLFPNQVVTATIC